MLYKDIKRLLVSLGFHHTWGLWVSNTNKADRVEIIKTKKHIYLNLSRNYNYFNLNDDRIIIDKLSPNMNDIKNRIEKYFE